ncbi:Protein phosphatase 2C/Stage II sporulation protein E (SpoIIE) [Novymonas esmeraldas]|uniref:Protein phosphatase n=1 Tax=Novymonas esmeraldas TaxID=1808958 RepID=A0AAW0EMM7_9TRYP
MGARQSVPLLPNGQPSAQALAQSKSEDVTSWGTPPEEAPDDEKDPTELVLQSWAFCKAKPSPQKMYRSDVDERKRRQSVGWRKRASFIELDCGEDSFFVANNYKVIGVADGVGGWRSAGVDASLFANALMENAKLFAETHRGERDPETILDAAYTKVVKDGAVKVGSSTACVATLRKEEDGSHTLDVANLGDSGVMVVRNRDLHFRAHEKVHGFNAPFQLAVLPPAMVGRAFSDRVRDCVRESTPVQAGDVVVMGTDGLFDNRFNSQLATDAGWVGKTEENPIAKIPLIGFFLSGFLADEKVEYVDPYRVAQRIVADTYKTSVNQEAHTPWAAMLRQYGQTDAKGGKPDDITVLLSRVTTREELNSNIGW